MLNFRQIEFGSYLTYCPRKEGCEDNDEIKNSKNIMITIKTEQTLGDQNKFASQLISEMIRDNLGELPFNNFFGENVALVPVPKSSLMKPGTLWVPDRIARALANLNLGIHYPCLERFQAVSKSSHSKPENRPKAIDHFNSIKVNTLVQQPTEFVLIDDVITRGASILGCANLLLNRFPCCIVRGFAVIRTISNHIDFNRIRDPCIGDITLQHNGETHRDP